MHILEHDDVRLAVDASGRLMELAHRTSGHNYVAGAGLWRLIYQRGQVLENEVRAEDCTPTISVNADGLTMRYDGVTGDDGPLAFALTIEARVRGDEVYWSIDLANREPGTVLREVHFPMLLPCRYRHDQALIWSAKGGQRFEDVRGQIARQHTQYMAPDHLGVVMATLYPGAQAATNCFLFASEHEGLYLASHDPSFQFTLHWLRLRGEAVDAGLVKYPFLAPGQSVRIGGYVTSPYLGDWHVAADKYRAWADTWFKPPQIPAWVRTLKGWQRLIMRHQQGDVHFRYDQLPAMHEEGQAAGIDTLFTFGWHQGGHDHGYPDYRFDEGQGGQAEFRKHLKEAQATGARQIHYYSGRLIDRATDYYKTVGQRICVRNFVGDEKQEFHHFSGRGTALRCFGHRTFVVACYACPEWFGELKRMADTAIDLGSDAVFYDQLGGADGHLCCDPAHGHPVPFTTMAATKADVIARLRQYVKERHPEMGFGLELISDVTAQHADFIHNWWGGCAVSDWRGGGKPALEGFLDFFRYTFPEVILSDREIRDDTDIERRVNHALLLGLRSDVEVYRCRATISAAPHYREYLTQANRLRDRYADLILAGRYRDTKGFALENQQLDARSFVSDDGKRLAVVLAQSHLAGAATRLVAEGHEYVEHDGIGQFAVVPWGAGVEVRLQRHALVVVVFEKA